jgi:predicted dehydrogenase
MRRRAFLESTPLPLLAQTKPAPSDRIGVGLIGCGGMGRMDLADFLRNPEVEAVAVCDVDGERAAAARTVAGGKARVFTDYRRLLELKEVDAVIVATPDHWHALQTVDACHAGKDVYVEKPVSYCVREGRLMVEAARRNRRVVQVGLQQRSGTHFQRAVKAVQEGRIGAVHYAQCWNHGHTPNPEGMGHPADSDPPTGFDWDLFVGPAPLRPYNRARRNFRVFHDYAGGELTNWGPHLIDIVHWALKSDAPLTVTGSGGKLYMKDARESEDTVHVTFEYPGFLLEYSNLTHNSFGHNGHPGNKPFGSYGILLHGSAGTLFIDRAGYEIVPQMRGASDPGAQGSRDAYDDLTGIGMYFTSTAAGERGTSSVQHLPHVRNFLDCIKSRALPAADIEIGHRSTTPCLLGNIALRTGVKLRWDAARERITNSAEADRLLTRAYRAPWRLAGL